MTTEVQQHDQTVFKVQDKNLYFVKSENEQKPDTYYIVSVVATCNCADYKYRHSICKHIERVIVEVRKNGHRV